MQQLPVTVRKGMVNLSLSPAEAQTLAQGLALAADHAITAEEEPQQIVYRLFAAALVNAAACACMGRVWEVRDHG